MDSSIVNISTSSVNSDHSRISEIFQDLLKPEDRILQTVRLEGRYTDRRRFLCIVSNEKAEEFCLLGIDCCSIETRCSKDEEKNDDDRTDSTKVRCRNV